MNVPLKLAVRLLIVAAICGLLAWQIDLARLWAAFDRRLLLAALAFQVPIVLAHLFYAQRHAILVRTPPIPLVPAVEAILLSGFLNLITPGRIAEIVKATYLRGRLGIPLPHGVSAIVIERLCDLVVVGAIAATGIAGILASRASYLIAIPLAALVGMLLLRPVSALVADRLEGTTHPLVDFVFRQCRHVVDVLQPEVATRAVILTVISWLAHFLALVWFFHLQPFARLTLPDVALVFGAIVFAGAIPALPAGIGLFEAAVVFVLQPKGFEFSQALALGIALHVAEIAASAILGPLVMFRRSTGLAATIADTLAMVRAARAQNKQPTP